ncbi:hypothetical protein [Tannockella kyphosi]|uniref:hypothetical protein n=1 Tax=Tannockella kyphosi TaxID=2899121 RepID=UPI00201284D5|nr:hypothetical protein [Tannockella kyphosi]
MKKRFSLHNMYLRNISFDQENNMQLTLDESYTNHNHGEEGFRIGKAVLTFARLEKQHVKASYYQEEFRKELSFQELKDHIRANTVEIMEEMYDHNIMYFSCIMDKINLDIKIYHDQEVDYQWILSKN